MYNAFIVNVLHDVKPRLNGLHSPIKLLDAMSRLAEPAD
jgi:hypothetical protein